MNDKDNKTPVEKEGNTLLKTSDVTYIGLMNHSLQTVSTVSLKK
jgi:hypothetical protein